MHILVIENERKIADLLRQVLTEEGYHVVVAYDGREGLDLCRLPEFDLLVLDLMRNPKEERRLGEITPPGQRQVRVAFGPLWG